MNTITKLSFLAALLSCSLGLRAQVPQIIGYQGKVSVSGVPWTGTGQFKFALVNSAGTTTYWSNDGTSSGGSQPSTAVSLAVSTGLFNVGLGDTSLANMTQSVPYSVFANSEVRLRTWFNDGTHGFQVLTPDQRIFAGGYAMYAANMSPSSTVNGASLNIGTGNTVSGGYSSVAGGYNNTASGLSTVGGGSFNSASGASSFVGGGGGSPLHMGNTASGDYSAVVGGIGNTASGFAAFIGGGGWDSVGPPNGNLASGAASTVGGGLGNWATNTHATVVGGFHNTAGGTNAMVGGGSGNIAGSPCATIAGGLTNWIQDSLDFASEYSAIGGGCSNNIWAGGSVIAGGNQNTISQRGNVKRDYGHCIGGGVGNVINYENEYSVIGGGHGNFVDASAATVGGGSANRILWVGPSSGHCIAGGQGNTISSPWNDCTIGGGCGNSVSGACSVIPGGSNNVASGSFSLAAGTGARAADRGSFVWADSQNGTFSSSADNQVSFRCLGGAVFTSGSGSANQTVSWTPGSGSWTFSSDRGLKDRIRSIDARTVLEKVSQLSISEWSYKGYAQRHIGPMAQDFHAAFGLNGEDDKHIATVDEDGVALAAIQGLNQKLQAKDTEIEELRQQNASLAQRLADLERTVRSLANER
jgi:trimeric autotransporter adhesin